jgi:enoyl-CoA hydratase/carnithine racemase
MSYSQIDYAVEDGLATLTLDRPAQLNAFTATMVGEVIDAFDRSDADDAVRAVVVTGAGRAFCAGADLSGGDDTFALAGDEAFDPARHMDPGGDVAMRVLRSRKPVIAAVNGAAVGIGVTSTLPMDIRLASEHARFGFVFARRGLVPECGSSWFLPRLVGHQRAAEWLFTGRLVGAEEALAAGLVRSVHPAGELLGAAYALAREIATNTSPVAVALTRRMLWEMAGERDPHRAHRLDSECVYRLGRSAEVREGVNAFLEKRPAEFPLSVSRDLADVEPDWDAPAVRSLRRPPA